MSLTGDFFNGLEKRKKKKDDIAPIRTTTKAKDDDIGPVLVPTKAQLLTAPTVITTPEIAPEKEWYDKIVKKPDLFDDGYQAGDISKTILGTGADFSLNVLTGVGNFAEGIGDTINYGIADIFEKVGNKDFANVLREETKKSVVQKLLGETTETVDKWSVLDGTSDSVAQGLGMITTLGAGGMALGGAGIGAAGQTALSTGGTLFSGIGSGMSEAYEGGATDEEARTYGLISGTADALSELIFGGLGKGINAVGFSKGLSSADDMLAKKISNMFSSQIAKNLTQYGIKASAEGLEEVLSGLAQGIGKKITYMSEEELDEILKDENLLEQFVVGSVTSAIAQSGDFYTSAKTGTDFITGLTENEQKVVDKEVENRIAEREKNGEKVTNKDKSKIYDKVVADLDKGYITIDTIESALGGEAYKSYKDTLDNETALKEEFDTLNKMKQGDMTGEQIDKRAELKQQLEELKNTSKKTELKDKLSNDVFNLVKDSRLAESYNEKTRREQSFEADLSKYDTKQQEVIKKAVESGILNNTNRTHEFVDMIAKISADKGVLFDFTNNEKLKNSGFAVEGKTVNGYKTEDGNIALNIQSHKALESVVGHEITHILEGTELYSALQEAVKQYATTKGEYVARMQSLRELYTGVYKGTDFDAKLQAELTADIVGDYLFSDSDFINSLSTEQPNLFKKIYNEIKYLCKVATAGSKEARELEKVKKAFENAWKESVTAQKNTTNKGDVKYLLSETTDGRIVAVVDNDILENIDTTSWDNTKKETAKKAASNALKQFNDGIVVDGITRKVNRRSRREYTRSDYTESLYNKTPDVFADKMRAADVADDIVVATTNWNRDGGLKHPRDDNFVDFDHGTTLIATKTAKYSAEVVVGITDNGEAVLYDVVDMKPTTFDIKKEESPTTATTQNAIGDIKGDSSTTILPQNSEKSSEKNDFPLSDSEGRELSTEQSEYFKESKIRDADGNLKVMYHGSPETFTVFDKKKARSGGTYGRGFYFTDSKSHAGTYGDSYVVYLNITNPLQNGTNDITKEQLRKFVEEIAKNEDYGIENYGYGATIDSVVDNVYGKSDFGMLMDLNISCIGDMVEAVKLFNEVNGTDYDGIVAPTETVAFHSEQIKDIDNKTPTENPDIHLSLSKEGEQSSKNGRFYGKDMMLDLPIREDIAKNTTTTFDDIAPLREEEANAMREEQNNIAPFTDADVPPEFDVPMYDATDTTSLNEKTLKNISAMAKDILSLNTREKKLMEDIVQKYSTSEISSKEELFDNIKKLFGEKSWTERNDEIAEIKKVLRDFRINVSPFIKRDITNYSQFMRSNFGKLRFSKDGLSVDDVYIGLSTAYPHFFPADVVNPTDQLLLISEVANTEINTTNTYELDDDVIQEATDVIAEEVSTYKEQQLLKLTEKEHKAFFKNVVASDKPIKTTRADLHNNIVDNIKTKFAEKGFDLDEVLKKAKDLSTFATVDNTPQRVMEKALGYKEGQILADETVNKVAQNETEGIKWLNSFTNKKNGLLVQISKQYNIKPGSKESAAAQMYAEGFYVNDNNDIIKYGDEELKADFPNAKVRGNIKGLANDPRIRLIYDETLAKINESRSRNAYPEIPRLENYFLHFRAMEDTFSRLGLPFNPNDIRAKDLPTDLNGVTADLKPGQPYFASAMHRTGKRTSFDLLGGLERYLSSAKNQIYHIDDIQTLRALRNFVADTYGQATGLENLDKLSEEDVQERIKQVYGSHLSTFAKFLNEEANILAGKTSLIDRGLEGVIGRRGITFLDTINKQVGSNMVGLNISSSLTNILPVVQTFAKSSKFAFTKAFAQTVSNRIRSIYGKSDGFKENSPVVIRRKGAESFYRTPFQKIGDTGYILMSAVDDIFTELIARTKYNELTQKGMDSQQAHIETDKWVSRLMGDRSLGQQPQLYNSKMLGLITKFQLEVRNQLDSQFYDTIQEAKVSNEQIENALLRNAKTAAKVGSTFFQLAVLQHLFGTAFESVAGYNPAFDIVEVLIKAFGFDDDEEDEDTALDNIEEAFLTLLEDLPYTSTLTGGRIPISSALPIKELVTGEDDYGTEKSRVETLKETLPYYLLPGGYGQLKKTVQGLKMFDDDLPIAGSYTDSGNLRFPVEDTPLNKVQAGLFGQYANKNARKYFDDDIAPLNEKQIKEYADLDLPIADYWKYREGLKGLETLNEKGDYIGDLDLPISKKNILINNIADRDKPIDYKDFDLYSDFEEFDFATRYPEKYAVLKEQGISVAEYKEKYEETAFMYTDDFAWASNNPEKYTLSKAVTNDVTKYKQYTTDLYNIKSDKDSNGKSISGSRKKKVLDYINNLNIDYGAKCILLKSEYSSEDRYNKAIVDYLNSRDDITTEEKKTILEELGATIDSKGYIHW